MPMIRSAADEDGHDNRSAMATLKAKSEETNTFQSRSAVSVKAKPRNLSVLQTDI